MEKEITKEKALSKLMTLCSKREICTGKARELMWRWGLPQEQQEEIIADLTKYKYIDDMRYARFFVRDKSRFSAWGRHKIAENLRVKRIPQEFITQALEEEYPESANEENIRKILQQKCRSVKYRDNYDLRNKLIRFGLSRGYDREDVFREVDRIVKNIEQD